MVSEKEESKQSTEFSIIIAVTHSLEDLELCLSSLEKLDFPSENFRVALVDCHVTPGLQEFFAEKLRNYNFSVTALSLPGNPRPGPDWLHDAQLNEARNYAVQRIPGKYYVFTEDDCILPPDWLRKFEAALTDETGAIGGPDFLPEGMGWFPRALDWILGSFFGTMGAKRGKVLNEEWYYPRKENTLIPASVFDRVGHFPEEMIFGAEIEMAKRIRDAGYRITYLPDNFVLHRRITTFTRLLKRNALMSSEKVKRQEEQGVFHKSPHFFVFLAVAALVLVGLLSLAIGPARSLLAVLIAIYIAILIYAAVSSMIHSRSLSVGLGVLLLMPFHHLSIVCGTIYGALGKKNPA
jgi:GT2 family glycosyltransferase